MFQGFPSLKGDNGPAIMGRIDVAARALVEFPKWAIEQACASIQRRGYQVLDKDGDSKTERHWPPSNPDICKVVEEMVAGRRNALANAEALLVAPVEEQVAATAEQKAVQVEAWRADWGKRITPETLETTLAGNAERRAEEIRERQGRRLLEDYRRRGVEPPSFKGRVLVSLSMLLQQGWTIQEVGVEGRRVLVAPPAKKVEPRKETRLNEMGS